MAVEYTIERRQDGYFQIVNYFTNHTGVVSIKKREKQDVEEGDILYTILRLGLIKNIRSQTSGLITAVNKKIHTKFCGYYTPIIQIERKLTPEEAQFHEEEKNYIFVLSPQGGNYYINRNPGLPPIINVGDTVEKGSLLAICMVMKKRREIVYDGERGKIAKIYFQSGQQCNEGDKLFGIILKPLADS